jgi:hypothetical protein
VVASIVSGDSTDDRWRDGRSKGVVTLLLSYYSNSMTPSVSISTNYDGPNAREPLVRMHLKLYDQERLRRVGKLGEIFACDITVEIIPINQLRSKVRDWQGTQHISDTLTWPGGVRVHNIGANNTTTTDREPLDSSVLKGFTLHGKEVSADIDRVRGDMERLSKAYLQKDAGMTKSEALLVVYKDFVQRSLNREDSDLKTELLARTPQKYRDGTISKKLKKRRAMYTTATGLTLIAAMNSATKLYFVEQAYAQLVNRA